MAQIDALPFAAAHGTVTYLVLEDQHRVDVLSAQRAG